MTNVEKDYIDKASILFSGLSLGLLTVMMLIRVLDGYYITYLAGAAGIFGVCGIICRIIHWRAK
jgi:hypothetical protein